MRIADRQVVEAALRGDAAPDREVRLVALDVEGLPVYQADADALVSRLAWGKGRGQIALSRVRAAGVRDHDRVVPDLEREAVLVDDVHVVGEPCAERVAL